MFFAKQDSWVLKRQQRVRDLEHPRAGRVTENTQSWLGEGRERACRLLDSPDKMPPADARCIQAPPWLGGLA